MRGTLLIHIFLFIVFIISLSNLRANTPLLYSDVITCTSPPSDTIIPSEKYQGYRLFLSQLKIEKETREDIRLSFNAINTGRKDIDFGKKGSEHWVQIFFDGSLHEQKLGGFKDNIRYALYNQNFKIETGKILRNQELKFSKVLNWELSRLKEEKVAEATINSVNFTAKGDERIEQSEEEFIRRKNSCPDLIISNVKILDQSKKYTNLEFSLSNIGKEVAKLSKKVDGQDALVGVRVHLSGVPDVSRGSLIIAEAYFHPKKGPSVLKPGSILTQTLKLDTRKKTDFLKYLVLSIDSYNLDLECDRTNNKKAIILQ